jgi:hypothetical protein
MGGTAVPTINCNVSVTLADVYIRTTTGVMYVCTAMPNTWTAISGGGGSPGGSTTQVQFNDSSAFGGDTGLTYDKTTDTLAVAGPITTGDGTVAGETRLFELSANGSNYRSWLAPDTLTATLAFRFPDTVPTAGQVMLFGAPSAGVSDITFGAASGAPGGSDTQIQRNNAGALGAVTGCTSAGTNITCTGGNLIATSPKVITDISDTNGNELLKVTATGSAVNEFTVANAASGNSPTLSATGSGTDLDINLVPKGTGSLVVGTSPDVGIARHASNVLEVNSGTAGTIRDIVFRTFKGSGTGAAQLRTAQTTAPTCTTNCGTSPTVAGTDTFMTVTLGTTPASGFLITFNGTWAAAPACTAAMGTTGMVVGKLPLTVVTTTTTITVVTNGTAPATGDKYHLSCGGTQ